MTAACPKCGEENCAEKRAAFAREPWLPGGFELGAQWYSYDGGVTWTRMPPAHVMDDARPYTMTVAAIDQKTGMVTIQTGWLPLKAKPRG